MVCSEPGTNSQSTQQLEQDEVGWYEPRQKADGIIFNPAELTPFLLTEMMELGVSSQISSNGVDIFVYLVHSRIG